MSRINSQAKILLGASIFIIVVLGLLSLPYSFVGFIYKSLCECFCPWWLFLGLELLTLLLYNAFYKIYEVKKQKQYFLVLAVTGFVAFLLHLIFHNFHVKAGNFQPTKACSWFWFLDLLVLAPFFIFSWREKD